MINPRKLEEIAQKIHSSIPNSIHRMSHELEKNIFQILQGKLAKLDLVTREEFDLQSELIVQLREKLFSLKERLDKLEIFFNEEQVCQAITEKKCLYNNNEYRK
jgi:hypothetical protein